jgi:hypothetical protein
VLGLEVLDALRVALRPGAVDRRAETHVAHPGGRVLSARGVLCRFSGRFGRSSSAGRCFWQVASPARTILVVWEAELAKTRHTSHRVEEAHGTRLRR